MQKLQLYLGTDRLDLFGDESVSVTQTIQNIRDISKVFTDFSQTFSIPASKKNNLAIKHYYNFNIVDGFDALNKVAGKIELNSLEFKSGYIRLEGVDMRKNKAYAYRITFFGNTVNLKDIIGEDMLSALGSLSTHNLIYSPLIVEAKLAVQETLGQAILCPLITHTKRLTYDSTNYVAGSGNVYWHTGSGANEHGVLWSDLKYAIRIDEIIKAIQEEYEITFDSTSFFNSTNDRYYHLFMWLHRKSGEVQPATQVPEYFSQVDKWESDISNKPYAIQTTTSMRLYVTASSVANLVLSPSTGSTKYRVIVYRNGASYFESDYDNGARTFGISDWGESLPIGTYTVTIVTNQSAALMSFPIGDIKWELQGFGFNIVLDTDTLWQSSLTIEFIITQQIPEQKVLDFLNGLFNLFNLTVYALPNGNIQVQTIDDYYAAGATYDITQYLEISKSKVDVALPFKQVNFEYEGLGTFLAKQYEQLNNVGWGTLRYTLDDAVYSAPTEIYTVKPPFEHVQFERLFNQANAAETTIQYGYFVNENEQPYFGKPLLFYPVTLSGGGISPISFLTAPSSHTEVTDYNVPSNSVALVSSINPDNLNFGAEINEYALTSAVFSDSSLFRKEYIDYVSAVFNTKRRITKVKAFLPLRIVIALKLNDKITMRNETYIINSVTTNLQTGESDFELLNVI
jgi:hypothetical protein